MPGVDYGIRVRYVSTFALYATIFTKAIVTVKSNAVARCVDNGTIFLVHVPVLDVICSMPMKTVLSLNHGVLIWCRKVWNYLSVGVVSFAASVTAAIPVHARNVIITTTVLDAAEPIFPKTYGP